jgi:hypothetical protein
LEQSPKVKEIIKKSGSLTRVGNCKTSAESKEKGLTHTIDLLYNRGTVVNRSLTTRQMLGYPDTHSSSPT